MFRLTDPGKIGQSLYEIRLLMGIPRREVARQIAEKTGRTETSCNAQVWEWDNGRRRPDLASLPFLLDALGKDLALVDKPGEVRSWPRLLDPPDDVMKVIADSGTVWTRMEKGGHYWASPAYPSGVTWAQVLRWGPVKEMKY